MLAHVWLPQDTCCKNDQFKGCIYTIVVSETRSRRDPLLHSDDGRLSD